MISLGSCNNAILIVFASLSFLLLFLGGEKNVRAAGGGVGGLFSGGGKGPSEGAKTHQKQPLPLPNQLTHEQAKVIDALIASKFEGMMGELRRKALQALIYNAFLGKLFPPSPSPESPPESGGPSTAQHQHQTVSTVEKDEANAQALLQTAVDLRVLVEFLLERRVKDEKALVGVYIFDEKDPESFKRAEKAADVLIQALREVRDKVRTPLFRLVQLVPSSTPGDTNSEAHHQQKVIYEGLLKRIQEKYTETACGIYWWRKGFLENCLMKLLADPLIFDNLLAPRVLHALKEIDKKDKTTNNKGSIKKDSKNSNKNKKDAPLSSVVDVLFDELSKINRVHKTLCDLIDSLAMSSRGNAYYYMNAKERQKIIDPIWVEFLQRLSEHEQKANASAIRVELAEHLMQKHPIDYSFMVSQALEAEFEGSGGIFSTERRQIAEKMIELFESVIADRKDLESTFSPFTHFDVLNTELLEAFVKQKDAKAKGALKEALLTLNKLDPELFRDYVQSKKVSYWNTPEDFVIFHAIARTPLQKEEMKKSDLKWAIVDKVKNYSGDEGFRLALPTVVCGVLKLVTAEFVERFGAEHTSQFVIGMAEEYGKQFHSRNDNGAFEALFKEAQQKLLEHLSADFLKRFQAHVKRVDVGTVLRRWFQTLGYEDVAPREVIPLTTDFLDQWTLQYELLLQKVPEKELENLHNFYYDDVIPGLSSLPSLLWTLPRREQKIQLLKLVAEFVARGNTLELLLETIKNALIGRPIMDNWGSKVHTREQNDAARAFLLKRTVVSVGWDLKSAEFLLGELTKAKDWYPQLETILIDKDLCSSRREELHKLFSRDVFLVFRGLSGDQRKAILNHLSTEKVRNRQTKAKSDDVKALFAKEFEQACVHCLEIPAARDKDVTISKLLDRFFPKQKKKNGGNGNEEENKKQTAEKEETTGGAKTMTVQERFGAFQHSLQQQFGFTECLLKQMEEEKTKHPIINSEKSEGHKNDLELIKKMRRVQRFFSS